MNMILELLYLVHLILSRQTHSDDAIRSQITPACASLAFSPGSTIFALFFEPNVTEDAVNNRE